MILLATLKSEVIVGAGSAGGVGFKRQVTVLSFMHIKHRAERNVVLADRSAKTVQHNIRHKNSKPSGATNAGVFAYER